MALTLIPPGARKGNKFYLARGSINGRVHEINTHEIDKRKASAFARKYEADVRGQPAAGDRVTFADAARRYVEFRSPSRVDRARIDRVVDYFGPARLLHTIKAADVHEAANKLAGHLQPATRNREVVRPAVTVLHYAASTGLVDYIRVANFREPRVSTRALDPEAAGALIGAAATDAQRRLLVWLFFQGTRISATLRLQWADIDLRRQVVKMFNPKGDRWEEFPLHGAVVDELHLVPLDDRAGPVFAGTGLSKSNVRRWLVPLCASVGVKFTPHMARHTLGTQLAASGASLATIMKALGHSQASSSLRYQSPDIEVVRAAAAKIDYRRKA